VLYPSQRSFPIDQAASEATGNLLVKAIQQMIQRRQSARRADEPPYRVQLCMLVRQENARTFLRAYRALEALSVPVVRRNLDSDDDVFAIVTGSQP
jgi:vacuolar-type H+-ATPase subunit B/Vma2